jgi:regulatory protein
MAARPASIKVRALQWLAQREHSRVELRSKLLRLLTQSGQAQTAWRRPARKGSAGSKPGRDSDKTPDLVSDTEADTGLATEQAADPTAEVEALLDWLESRGYLSPDRFIESRVHARQARFGNLRIRQELQQHGLSLDADTQQALRQTELQRAHGVWLKKYGTAPVDAANRLRQMRFLAGRGFSMDVVRRVLQGGDALAEALDLGPAET